MSVAQVTVDLANCDREPIHIPGNIQPHGFLLATRGHEGLIEQASTSAAVYLGCAFGSILGHTLTETLGPVLAGRLAELTTTQPLGDSARYLLTGQLTAPAPVGEFEVVAHRMGHLSIFEFEELRQEVDSEALVSELYESIARMDSAGSMEESCASTARELRRLTGFDRVLLYRFDEDGSGIVLAEDRNDRLPSYFDLRFPASDIPQQARRLYALNRIRIIPDVNYTPSPVEHYLEPGRGSNGSTAAPLDLSGSILRSVSPVHREYMRNMGTAASMSVSILVNGVLWGLVSFHHREPRLIPFRLRSLCDLLAQILSIKIAGYESASALSRAVELKRIQTGVLTAMASEENFIDGLRSNAADLLRMVDAGGSALVIDNQCYTAGIAPPEEAILSLAQWLFERGERELFSTETLASVYPPAESFCDLASGLIAVSLSRIHRSYFFWFRPELVRSVQWAGEPAKSVRHTGPTAEIHPRNSFANWKETVRGHSKSWSPVEIDAARDLRKAILEIVLKRAEEIAELVTELEFANKELEAFSYSVSHDLRAPFRHISGFSELLLEEEKDKLSERGVHYIQTIIGSAKFAGLLVDTLLNFSRIARLPIDPMPVDMQTLVRDQWSAVYAQEGSARAIAFTVDALPSVRADLTLMRQVIRNLLSNAVKYTRKNPEAAVDVSFEDHGSEYVFSVRDNGVGFDQAYAHKLFGVFQRLHRAEEFEGTGIGLANIRRIVSRHGGRTWAEGKLSQGATFFFSLPRRESDNEESDVKADPAGGR